MILVGSSINNEFDIICTNNLTRQLYSCLRLSRSVAAQDKEKMWENIKSASASSLDGTGRLVITVYLLGIHWCEMEKKRKKGRKDKWRAGKEEEGGGILRTMGNRDRGGGQRIPAPTFSLLSRFLSSLPLCPTGTPGSDNVRG